MAYLYMEFLKQFLRISYLRVHQGARNTLCEHNEALPPNPMHNVRFVIEEPPISVG